MPVPVLVVAGLAVVLAGVVLTRVLRGWLRYRGARVITCPENRRPAGVQVDSWHAATMAVHKQEGLRLSTCSRWPERAGCGQQCLAQIETSPEDCLVRNILTRWYEGKVCASCGQPIGEIQWAVRKPALLRADKLTLEWSGIPADKLHETLAAALPVCFACHMANTLVREHPELVVERSRTPGPPVVA